jgi:hypothetical protein
MVEIYDFSTRFAFRSYGVCSQPQPTLKGEGDGSPDGTSRLVVDGLSPQGTAFLLVGTRMVSMRLEGTAGMNGCEPRLLVHPTHVINLGSGSSHIEYILRLGRHFSLGDPTRFRFQVMEVEGTNIRTSNGVVWTVRW